MGMHPAPTGPLFFVSIQPSYSPTAGADSSAAFNEARAAAVAAGGGTIVLPRGEMSTAARLELRDGISVQGYGQEVS